MAFELKDDEFKWDNLWESEEAIDAVTDWLNHPGYAFFKRRCVIAETIQLRQALDETDSKLGAGIFRGMVRTRKLAELMESEAHSVERENLTIPSDDPDDLHAALLRFLLDWEEKHG